MGVIFDWGYKLGLKYTYEKDIEEGPVKEYKMNKEELEKYFNRYREVKYVEGNNE